MKIRDLEEQMENERNEFELEKKANEIYTEGFSKIREIICQHSSLEG